MCVKDAEGVKKCLPCSSAEKSLKARLYRTPKDHCSPAQVPRSAYSDDPLIGCNITQHESITLVFHTLI